MTIKCFGTQKFVYDRIFDEFSDIRDIYHYSLGPIVQSAAKGKSGSLFTSNIEKFDNIY